MNLLICSHFLSLALRCCGFYPDSFGSLTHEKDQQLSVLLANLPLALFLCLLSLCFFIFYPAFLELFGMQLFIFISVVDQIFPYAILSEHQVQLWSDFDPDEFYDQSIG